MRRLLFLSVLASAVLAAEPPELAAALKNFRGDAPPGWSFTQTTTATGESLVERCDAAKASFERWSLVQKNGRAPTEDEMRTYAEGRSRRSGGGTGPRLAEQLDFSHLETVTTDGERATYRCGLRPGEKGDDTAKFLRVTIVLHQPTGTIESFELASSGPFKPTFGVSIAEMRTTMTYSLPAGDTPSLPQKVATRLRGRAFIVKSLDADMTVTFTDYVRAVKR